MPVESEVHETALARRAFEVARARAGLQRAVEAAAADGMTQRMIARALGTNQAAVHRILRKARALPESVICYDRPEAQFHLELHREIARHVLAGDVSFDRARRRLDRMRATSVGATKWLDRWDEILSLPREDMAAAILAGGSDGDDLRQVSPLLGEVSDIERAAALERAYSR